MGMCMARIRIGADIPPDFSPQAFQVAAIHIWHILPQHVTLASCVFSLSFLCLKDQWLIQGRFVGFRQTLVRASHDYKTASYTESQKMFPAAKKNLKIS